MCVLQEDTELLVQGYLSAHAALVVRLRRAEKNILKIVAQYAAQQKASAAERASAAAAHDDGCDDRVRVHNVPTATGEEEFVRVDGVRVYGSVEERASLETEFRNSVLRGDYLTFSKTSAEQADGQPAVASEPESESLPLGSMKIVEAGEVADIGDGVGVPSL